MNNNNIFSKIGGEIYKHNIMDNGNDIINVINKVDGDELKQIATPRATTTLSTAKVNKISSMRNSGYTISEIAKALGVSTSTINKYLK